MPQCVQIWSVPQQLDDELSVEVRARDEALDGPRVADERLPERRAEVGAEGVQVARLVLKVELHRGGAREGRSRSEQAVDGQSSG